MAVAAWIGSTVALTGRKHELIISSLQDPTAHAEAETGDQSL